MCIFKVTSYPVLVRALVVCAVINYVRMTMLTSGMIVASLLLKITVLPWGHESSVGGAPDS